MALQIVKAFADAGKEHGARFFKSNFDHVDASGEPDPILPVIALQREIEKDKYSEDRVKYAQDCQDGYEAYKKASTMWDVMRIRADARQAGRPKPLTFVEFACAAAGIDLERDRVEKFVAGPDYGILALYIPIFDLMLWGGFFQPTLLPALAPKVVPTKTRYIKGMTLDVSGFKDKIRRTGPGGALSEIMVQVAEKTMSCDKIGCTVKLPREVKTEGSIALLETVLNYIGLAANEQVCDQLVDCALNGDGNSNPAPTYNGSLGGWASFAFADLLGWKQKMPNGVEITDVVGTKIGMGHIYQLDEFKANALGYYEYAREGTRPRVFGGEAHEFDCITLGLNDKDDIFLAWRRQYGLILREYIPLTTEPWRIYSHDVDAVNIILGYGCQKPIKEIPVALNALS